MEKNLDPGSVMSPTPIFIENLTLFIFSPCLKFFFLILLVAYVVLKKKKFCVFLILGLCGEIQRDLRHVLQDQCERERRPPALAVLEGSVSDPNPDLPDQYDIFGPPGSRSTNQDPDPSVIKQK
jgi:hypothetical protein